MLRYLFWGGVGAWMCLTPASSDVSARFSHPFVLAATAEAHMYGLWLTAPDDGCLSVRYVVSADGARLGSSGALTPGEGVLVHIGRGFAYGSHDLAITGIGCDAPPAIARRVRLGKPSPDHSWLAQ